jgi:hypothetical protein
VDASSETPADTTNEPSPDVAPDAFPDTTPDVAPDAFPDTTPDVAPDAFPDTTPDVVEEDDACIPDCTGRQCGPDPVCAVSCGTCTPPEECDGAGQCVPPCDLHVFEDFTDSCTPPGWTVTDWGCQNFNNYTGGSGMYRTVDSWGEAVDAAMITDWYDASGCSTVFLDFGHRYEDYSGDTDRATVDITLDGTEWINVRTYEADDDTHQHLDLQRGTWGGQDLFRIRFRYVGDNDGGWDVDDVEISGS